MFSFHVVSTSFRRRFGVVSVVSKSFQRYLKKQIVCCADNLQLSCRFDVISTLLAKRKLYSVPTFFIKKIVFVITLIWLWCAPRVFFEKRNNIFQQSFINKNVDKKWSEMISKMPFFWSSRCPKSDPVFQRFTPAQLIYLLAKHGFVLCFAYSAQVVKERLHRG